MWEISNPFIKQYNTNGKLFALNHTFTKDGFKRKLGWERILNNTVWYEHKAILLDIIVFQFWNMDINVWESEKCYVTSSTYEIQYYSVIKLYCIYFFIILRTNY